MCITLILFLFTRNKTEIQIRKPYKTRLFVFDRRVVEACQAEEAYWEETNRWDCLTALGPTPCSSSKLRDRTTLMISRRFLRAVGLSIAVGPCRSYEARLENPAPSSGHLYNSARLQVMGFLDRDFRTR